MSLTTLKINDVNLDVYYTCDVTHDAYGTGDSPTGYEVEIQEVEVFDSSTDIKCLLSDAQLNEIELGIIKLESGG